jgi:diaminopimelate decarboxylase
VDYFEYRGGELIAEGVPLARIAREVGTPCYVYSRATVERHYRAFDSAFGTHPHSVCYAVKANSTLAVLDVLARLGSGFDIVSVGELERVLRAGGDPAKVVFSGVGKNASEMRRALETGIRCFNVESVPELNRLAATAAALGVSAPVALRVNPDVDARTHPYIATGLTENKFGIPIAEAREAYQLAARLDDVDVIGVACHIGSQLVDNAPFVDALDRVLSLAADLERAGVSLKHIDIGGGLGIRYRDEAPPEPQDYARELTALLDSRGVRKPLLIEPGRAIVGNAGVLLTRIEYVKDTPARRFAIVDAAMNDLLRPSLYGAWQEIVPVSERGGPRRRCDIVGPVCETADFLGKDRELAVEPGDLLAVRSAGAYGMVMSSNYNSRPRVAEVMVDGDRFAVVRQRETLEDLLRRETVLPW